jgi:hypothetical protein
MTRIPGVTPAGGLWSGLLLIALALVGCTPVSANYDTDGDGALDYEDCAPDDPSIHPGPEDEPGDGIDQNCDGVDGVLDCDDDDDTFIAAGCGGDDCDDDDGSTFPGAAELCDGLDNDCDDEVPREEVDADADEVRPCQGDCDDLDGDSWPEAPELCDGIDNDCDGLVPDDELDGDGDGESGCAGDCDDVDPELDGLDLDGDGFSSCDGDCDDLQPLVHPGAAQRCDDGVLDNDCDGVIDPPEVDGDGDGVTPCDLDCDDDDPTVHPWSPEVCDGVDNDCDLATDDVDADADGEIAEACGGADCDDDDPTLLPGQPELCDGLDNDCDPTTDEAVDADGDGFTLCEGDCEPTEVLTGPGAAELCDGLDDDCDGDLDEDCVTCDAVVPADYAGIQAALDGVADGAVVCVEPGTWLGDLNPEGKAVHLVGVAGPTATVVEGSGTDSVVTLGALQAGLDTTIEKLTLTGGHSVGLGGGLLVVGVTPTIRDLIVTGNSADFRGGGVGIVDTDVDLVDLVITDNQSPQGGGLALDQGATVTLTGGLLSGNLADEGGAVFVTADGQLPYLGLHGVLIEGNQALYRGGGVFVYDGDIGVTATTVTDNQADMGGGLWIGGPVADGIYDDLLVTGNVGAVGGGMTLHGGIHTGTDVVLNDNVANRGAGLRFTYGSLELYSSEMNGNEAWLEGGGASIGNTYANETSAVFDDLLVADNEAAYGGGLHLAHAGPGLVQVGGGTFVGNAAYTGAGVHVDEVGGWPVSLVMWDSLLADGAANHAGGGGSATSGASLQVMDSVVQDNTAVTIGGGFLAEDGATLTLDGVEVVGNIATGDSAGGGVAVNNASVNVWHGLISGNVARNGGGLRLQSGSDAWIGDTRIIDNTAQTSGGGLSSYESSFEIQHTWVAGNDSGYRGGGLYQAFGDGLVDNLVLLGNEAAEGGGVYSFGDLDLSYSAVVGNEADLSAGLYLGASSSDPVWLTGVVVTGNSAANSKGGVTVEGWTTPTVTGSDCWGNTPDDWSGMADPSGVNGNVSVDPLWLDATSADPVDWDLHLQTGSPLVDIGPDGALDPDGGPADVGPFGGPGANSWDLDGDGAPLWWMPGSYLPSYPAAGWDCDDLDDAVGPAGGC